jgi:hypothetical protein
MDDNVAVADQEIGKAFLMTGTLEEGRRQEFELPVGTTGTTLSCAITYVPLRDNTLIGDLVLAKEDLGENDRRLIRTLFASSAGVTGSRWRAANGGALVPIAFIENENSGRCLTFDFMKSPLDLSMLTPRSRLGQPAGRH